MQEYIDKDLTALEVADEARREQIVELTLNAFLERVGYRKDTIDALFQSSTRKSEYERGVMEFISKYVKEVSDDRLTVTEYVAKNRSKQQVYVFLGTHWQWMDVQLYYVFIKRCCRRMGLDEIYCEDVDFMNALFERVAFRIMDYRKQRVTPGEVWINLLNCTLEIKADGRVVEREHRAEDFFTYVLPYVYSPGAECPRFHAFLDRVLPEAEMQTLVAESIGYCFTKNLKLEKTFVFYGTGSNGKSVLLDVITKLLGSSNVSNVTMSALTCDDEKRALIEGKLANISHESNGKLDTAMLKQLISGEPTEVRVLYRGTHTMHDIPKLFTSYNRLPPTESTHGFFRRWILFPFKVVIGEKEQDVDLVQKLGAELPGILNWVLEALSGLVRRKTFTKSEACEKALHEYVRMSNSVMQFMDEVCEIDDASRITLADLYKAYGNFCLSEELKKFGKKNFKEIIQNFGVKSTSSHRYTLYNIRLKELTDGII